MRSGARLGRRAQHNVVIGTAALLGAALAASPTGTPVVDQLWCAGFAGGLAWIGAYARREVTLAVAAGSVAAAVTSTSLGFGALAVVLAALNALRPRAALRLNGAAAGAIALSLLTGSGPEPRWLAGLTSTILAAAVLWAGMSGAGGRRRRLVRRGALVLGAGLALAVLLGGIGGALARPELARGVAGFRTAATAARTGDVDTATARFRSAGDALGRGRRYLRTLALPGRAVPFLAQQVRAGDTAVDAAADAAEVGRRTSADLSLEALEFEGGRIDLTAIAEAEAPLAELAGVLDQTVRRLRGIDRALLLSPLSAALDDAGEEAAGAGRDAARLLRGVQVAPPLLGADGPRRYLVLLTTPVEARNRFGFPGAYAVLSFDDGRFAFERSGPIADLIPPDGFDQAAIDVPPRVEPYVDYRTTELWQSATIPPHFPAVAELATQLAAQSTVGDVDGVLVADPTTIAAIVGLVGDVALADLDLVLTRETTADFITRRQYVEFLDDQQADRKDLLAVIAETVGRRLEAASLPPVDELIDVFSPLLAADHLAIGISPSTSPAAADLLAETGADGGFDVEGDVLHIGHLNAVGNKIDLFLQRSLTLDVAIDGDGALTTELAMALTNTAPSAGLPAYVLGSVLADPPPNGTNRTTLLLYSPHQLDAVALDGDPVPFAAFVDGDVFGYEVRLDLGPGQRRVLTAVLSGVAEAGPYGLTVVPNGLVDPDEVTLRVDDARTGSRTEEVVSITTPVVLGAPQGSGTAVR